MQVNTKVFHCRDLLNGMRETLGQRLKRLRKAKGLTQVQLASIASVGQSAIGNIEAGTRGYGASVVPIAKALDTTPEYLQMEGQGTAPVPRTPVVATVINDSAPWSWPFKKVSAQQYGMLNTVEQELIEDNILVILRARESPKKQQPPAPHIANG